MKHETSYNHNYNGSCQYLLITLTVTFTQRKQPNVTGKRVSFERNCGCVSVGEYNKVILVSLTELMM